MGSAYYMIEVRARQLAMLMDYAETAEAAELAFLNDDVPAPKFRVMEANDDIALVNAMLDVERSHREKQWAALEALLPLIPPGGDVSEVIYLPRHHAVRALRLLFDCGWWWDAHDERA